MFVCTSKGKVWILGLRQKFHKVLRKRYSKSKAGKALPIYKENKDNGHAVQIGIELGNGHMMTDSSDGQMMAMDR